MLPFEKLAACCDGVVRLNVRTDGRTYCDLFPINNLRSSRPQFVKLGRDCLLQVKDPYQC